MEQTVELRIRRVTRDKYDIVLLRDDSVSVEHGVTFDYALHWLRCQFGSRLFELRVGDGINFRSQVRVL